MKGELLLRSNVRAIAFCAAVVLTLAVVDSPAQSSCVSPPPGLVSWWRAEGNAFDSISGNNGIFTNVDYAPGEVGTAFSFGASNSVRIPAAPSLNVGAGAGLTIEGWIKSADNTYGRPIAEWVSPTTGGYAVHFFAHQSFAGTLYADLFDTAGNHHEIQSAAGLVHTNVFQHVAVTYDKESGVARLYIDGSIVQQSALGTFTPQTAPDLSIGYRPNTVPFGPIPFLGLIDELSIYSRALGSNEVQAIYEAGASGKCSSSITCVPAPSGLVALWRGEGNATDSQNGNNGTFTAPEYGTGEVGSAFNFDGSGNNVRVPASPKMDIGAGGGMTIESWIFSTDNTYTRPIAEWVSPTTGALAAHFYAHQHGPGVLYANLFDTAGNHHMIETQPGLVQTNVYQHVAVTYDKTSGIARLFVNGALATESNLGSFTPQTSPDFSIGYRPNTVPFGPIPFFGRIDELSLYSRALDTNEVQAVYRAGAAGKCFTAAPPTVTQQPTNQTGVVGGQVSFTVAASGTPPLFYQWLFGTNVLSGATSSTLLLTNLQPQASGLYSVVVSNAAGSTSSSNVTLTIERVCAPLPPGLVAWWPGEGSAADSVSGNTGKIFGGVSIVPGKSGRAFGFDGTGYIVISNSPSLSFSNQLSIELWYLTTQPGSVYYTIIDKRVGAAIANYGINNAPNGLGVFYDDPTVNDGDDTPFGSIFEVSRYFPAPAPNVFHHLAATYLQLTNNQVQLRTFVDGQLVRTRMINGNLANTVNGSPVTIGAAAQGAGEFFNGVIDEVSIYNRVLSPTEVLAIYNADTNGKCSFPVPPSFVQQPQSQNVVVGAKVSFTGIVAGSTPLNYQWFKDGVLLSGKSDATLTISNAQVADAGSYLLTVTNASGFALSLAASLTVSGIPPCQTAPPGLISWWRGNNSAEDSVGGNNGILRNGVTFVPGEVGNAFAFNGVNQYVEVPDAPSLNPTNTLSLETWVYVTGNPNTDVSAIVYKFSPTDAALNQYQLDAHLANGLRFRPVLIVPTGYAAFDGKTVIQFNTWYHVAMTYDGSSLNLYVNGTLDGTLPATGPVAAKPVPLLIGGPSAGPWAFNGRVDEVSLYDRALSASEVQAIYNAGSAGKCPTAIAPSFEVQPQNQNAAVGGSAMFSAVVAGSLPMNLQWWFNDLQIPGATNSSLTLSNISKGNAGSYSLVALNSAGSITSSVAHLTVTLPPSSIQIAGANVGSDGTVTVPVNLVANGNENAAGFSIDFDPSLLTYQGVALSSGASNGSLLINSSQVASGQLGVAVAMPAGVAFQPGTQQVAVITFTAPVVTSAASSQINFGDSPIKRQVVDTVGAVLAVTFVSGSVALPLTPLEGDVYPRPGGDEALTISDWVLVGRYVAALDAPTNALEFQRADCAPRNTLGDGSLTVSDWVQAGRYAVGLDPIVRAGGPTSPVPAVVIGPALSSRKSQSNPRQLALIAPILMPGQSGTIQVSLQAQGDENALAFSLSFDPAQLVFTGASAAGAGATATLNVNANQAIQGRLGFALALPTGQSFVAGTEQLVNISFRPEATVSGTAAISFTDQPVLRGVADPNASVLPTDYIDGAVVVNPLPSLKIGVSGNAISLSWPASAAGFVLQESTDSSLTASSWAAVGATPVVSNNQNVVSLATGSGKRFYRLYHP